MKPRKILSLCIVVLAGFCGSCKDKAEYPVKTIVGEQTLAGDIIAMPNPCVTQPCLPGMVLGLATDSGDYVLSLDSVWIWDDTFTVEDIEYSEGDEAEITGTVSFVRLNESEEYIELEIETISKVSE
jgi:hypothetical protein